MVRHDADTQFAARRVAALALCAVLFVTAGSFSAAQDGTDEASAPPPAARRNWKPLNPGREGRRNAASQPSTQPMPAAGAKPAAAGGADTAAPGAAAATSPASADDNAELERLRRLALASTQPDAAGESHAPASRAIRAPGDAPPRGADAATAPGPAPANGAQAPAAAESDTSRAASTEETSAAPEAAAPEAAAPDGAAPDKRSPATILDLLRNDSAPDPDKQVYRFDYVDTEWKDVLADFSRRSGLSVVGDVASAAGQLTYHSQKDLNFDEALNLINELLMARPLEKVLVKRVGNELHVKRLPDWLRLVPVERMYRSYDEYLAAKLGNYDVASVMYDCPANWTPAQVIEKFRPMFADVFDVGVMGDKIRLVGVGQDIKYFHEVIQYYANDFQFDRIFRPYVTFVLKQIQPSEARNILQQLFPPSAPVAAGGPRGQPAAPDADAREAGKVDFFVDDVQHTLSVCAVPSKIAEIRRVIDILEATPRLPDRERRFYEPKHRSPDEVIEAVATIKDVDSAGGDAVGVPAGGRRPRPGQPPVPPGGAAPAGGRTPEEDLRDFDLAAVPGMNSVLISGRAAGIQRALELIALVDVPRQDAARETLALQHRDADEAVSMISQMFPELVGGAVRPPRPGQPPQAAVAGGAAARVSIVVDGSSGKLILSGRAADIATIREFVAQIDVDSGAVQHFYRPTALKPSELADLLTRIEGTSAPAAPPVMPPGAAPQPRGRRGARTVAGGGGANVIGDDNTGQLIITCTEPEWAEYLELIAKLDVGEAKLHKFALRHANAQEMVDMLAALSGEGGKSRAAPRPGQPPAPAGGGGPTYLADERTNTVLVYAAPSDVPPIEKLIGELDIESALKRSLIKLQFADAGEVAGILTETYRSKADLRRSGVADGGDARPRRGGPQQQPGAPSGGAGSSDVRIVAEPMTNALVVLASEEDTAEIRQLALKMDAAAEPQIIALKFADAAEIAPVLLEAVGAGAAAAPPGPGGGRRAARSGGGATVRIAADPFNNRLIVNGSENEVAQVRALVALMDTDDASQIRTIVLKHAPAMDAAAQLAEVFGGGGPAAAGGRGRAAAATAAVRITAEPRTNSLVIKADKATFDQISAMALLLDQQELYEPTFVKLEHAKARDVASELAEMFASDAGRGGAPAKGARPGDPAALAASLVEIKAEEVTNQLVIKAPKVELSRILSLVKLRDDPSVADKRLVFTCQNRPAGEVAATLRDVFGSASARPTASRGAPQGRTGAAASDGGKLSIFDSGDQIILDGPAKLVLEAFEMGGRLDRLPAAETVKVYAVSDAEVTAAALQALLAGGAGRPGGRGGDASSDTGGIAMGGDTAGGRGRGGDGANAIRLSDIKVYADTYRSLVFVSAPTAKIPIIDAMIAKIENPEPPPGADGEALTLEGNFHVTKLKHLEASEMIYALEDIFNKKGGPTFKIGPDDYTLVVQCKPREWPQVENVVQLYDQPKRTEREGVLARKRITLPTGVSAAQIALLLKQQYGDNIEIEFDNTGDLVEEIDFRKGSSGAPDAGTNGAIPDTIHPCVLPRSILAGLPAISVGQLADPPSNEGAKAAETDVATAQPPANSTPADASAPARQKVRVIVDDKTGELNVIGLAEDVIDFEKHIEDLTEEADVPVVTKLYILAYTDVTYAQQLLEQIFNDRPAAAAPQPQPQRPQQPGQGGKGGQPNPQQAQADAAKQAMEQMAQQLAASRSGGKASKTGGQRVRVIPDTRGKKLYVKAAVTDFPLITAMLRTIDVQAIVDVKLRVFQLKNLDAVETAERIKSVVFPSTRRSGRAGQGPNRMIQAGGQPGGEGGQPQPGQPQPGMQPGGQPGGPGAVAGGAGGTAAGMANEETTSIEAHPETNSIIVVAERPTMELVETLINDLESRKNVNKYDLRIVMLENARANDIASAMTQILRGEQQAGGGSPGGRSGSRGGGGGQQVVVTPDAGANRVLLAGPSEELNRVEKMIKDLDAPTGSQAVVKIYEVKGDPQGYERTLRELFVRQQGGGQAGAAPDVVITSDQSTSTIIARATPQMHEKISEHISGLDARAADQARIRTVQLTIADAEKVAQKLTTVFQDRAKKGQQPLKITGINDTKTLFVQAPDELFTEIETHARAMDKQPIDLDIRSFPLKKALATDAVKRMDELIQKLLQAKAVTGGGADLGIKTFAYTADPLTNSILVTGEPMAFAIAQKVIEQIDVDPKTPMTREIRTYVLQRSVDVRAVAQAVQALYAGRGTQPGIDPPSVSTEPNSNILLVTANATQHGEIKGVVDQMTTESAKAVTASHFHPLQFARADELRITLEDYLRKWKQSRGDKPSDNIQVTADVAANGLIVVATDTAYEEFKTQLAKLDVKTDQRTTKSFPIRFADPNALVQIINQQYQNRGSRNPNDVVSAAFEWGTSSLVVTANSNNMKQVEELVQQTDTPGATMKKTHFIKLKDARADMVAQVLTQVWNAGVRFNRQGPPVVITADTANNQVIVYASDEDYAKVAEQVRQMDVPSEDMQTRTFVLKYAAPDAVVNIINTQFVSQTRNPLDQVKAGFEWGTQSVVVTANARNMGMVEKLIQSVDVEGTGDQQRLILTVENSNSRDVAQALTQIYTGARQSSRQGVKPATFSAVPNSNQIVVAARPEEIKEIQDLVKQLDSRPGYNGREAHVVTTLPEHVKAKSVAESINKMYSVPGSDSLKAEANEATNTLLVFATESEFGMVNKQLIEPLSQTPNIAELEVYQIPLQHANAEEVAKTLNDFFKEKRGQSSRSGFFDFGPSQQKAEEQTTITAETQSNTLIVACTPKTKELIDSLLKTIDTDVPPGGPREMEMFVLKYMDAADMLKILQEFLKVNKRASTEDPDAGLPWWARGGRSQQKDEQVVLAGDTRLTMVESQNSIIAVAKKETLEDIRAKIREMDQPSNLTSTTPKRIPLKYVNAAQIVTTLEKLFIENKSGGRTGGTTPYLQTTIVAEETTNTILVKARPSEFAQIEEMVRMLDTEEAALPGGPIKVIPAPGGSDVVELARSIEKLINDGERNLAQQNKGYKPQLVSIQPDVRTNSLLVSGALSKHQMVESLVTQLAMVRPGGGTKAAVIRPSNISPQDAAKLIQEMQRARGGRRGDADWPRDRLLRDAVERRAPGSVRTAVLLSMAACAMGQSAAEPAAEERAERVHVARNAEDFWHGLDGGGSSAPPAAADAARNLRPDAAVATGSDAVAGIVPVTFSVQTPPPAKAAPPRRPDPIRIRGRADRAAQAPPANAPASQPVPAAQPPRRQPNQPAPRPGDAGGPANAGPARPGAARPGAAAAQPGAGMIRTGPAPAGAAPGVASTQKDSGTFVAAGELTGAPLTVNVVGDSLVIIGQDEDVALIQQLLEIADQGSERSIQFIKLNNAKASDLAKSISDVFKQLVQKGGQQREDDKVEVVADTRSNSLFVVASDKQMAFVLDLISQADETSSVAGSSIKAFMLENRLAKDVKPVLEQLLQNWLKQKGADTTQISVTVDEATNAVFVTAGQKDLEEIENIVKVIDAKPGEQQEGRKSPMGTANIMLYPLRVAKADELATLLNKMLEDAKSGKTPLGHVIRELRVLDDAGNPIVSIDLNQPVFAFGDPGANTLVMGGPTDVLTVLKAVVQKFDVAPLRHAVELGIRTLKHADAAELSESLKKMIDEGKKLTAPPSEGSPVKGVPEGGAGLAYNAVINPDPRTNTIFFAGTAEAVKLINDFLDDIDVPGLPQMPVTLIALKHASATEMEPILTDVMKQRADSMPTGPGGNAEKRNKVVIKADARSNALIVACSADSADVVRQTVAALDQEIAFAGEAEFFLLKHNTAGKVKEAVDKLFEGGIYRPGGVADDKDAVGKARNKVTVVSDDRSNSVVVSASPENLSIVRQLITRMDADTPWTPAMMQVFDLVHADAVKTAAILQEYFEKLKEIEGAGDRQNVYVPTNVFADERTNRVIVSAAPEGLAKAKSLLERLDVPPGSPSSEFRVYALRDASASKLAPMIEELFEERRKPRGQQTAGGDVEVPFAIKPEELGNSLVVCASRDDHAMVASLVQMLDKPSGFANNVKLFPLQKANASDAKETLDSLYESISQSSSSSSAGGKTPVSVAVDERLNALIVYAPPGELAGVADLINQIDAADPGMELSVRVLPLENADATKTAELLNDIMSGNLSGSGSGGGSGSGTEASTVLVTYFDKDPYGKELLLQTVRERAKVWADERTNAVIVIASPTGVNLIAALVNKLDLIKKREVMVKSFTLRNADAKATVDLLESIFAQEEGSQQQEEFQQGRELNVAGGASGGGGPVAQSQTGPTAKGTFGKPRATFTEDERTNSVVVAGWPEDIQVAADIITQLDAQNIQERVHFVYAVQNTKAVDLQTALQDFYSKEVERLGQGGEGISEQTKQAEEVSVVAHEETNQLVVSVAPRKLSQVEQIVRQLDTAPAQVMIQVLLAEVNLDDSLEFGLEWAIQDLRFTESAVVGPNGTVMGSGYDVVSGVDLGAPGSGGLGGFTFTLTGEDFNFLMRALQTTGRLEVLQRPSIMVQDNQTANITVGQNVPFIRGTQTTDSGQTNASVEYEEVGVLLEVTPNINPDGWVYLNVKPEISSITDSSVPLGNGVNAPIFRKQSADTTVVVRDGETVVIGGLIVDSTRSSENKVPVIGDLPGAEFLGLKTVRRTTTRSELMIVLTPRVVRTVEDARALSIEERDRSELTPEMKQNRLMERLQVVPEAEDEIGPSDGADDLWAMEDDAGARGAAPGAPWLRQAAADGGAFAPAGRSAPAGRAVYGPVFASPAPAFEALPAAGGAALPEPGDPRQRIGAARSRNVSDLMPPRRQTPLPSQGGLARSPGAPPPQTAETVDPNAVAMPKPLSAQQARPAAAGVVLPAPYTVDTTAASMQPIESAGTAGR